ncbi:hypothetical protein ACFC3P_12500 [Enterococcus thailandicus]|uniref:hypothetical protein n=1 Tax=Enterococcus thailandicus TaxID=417368 RepID=UPI0039A49AEB
MKIIAEAKNGQPTQIIKTYDEFTELEKQRLIIPAGEKLEDYDTYLVHYNKNGKLMKIATYSFSEASKKERANRIDLVDTLQVSFGKNGSESKDKAKERVTRKLAAIDTENNITAEQYADGVVGVAEDKPKSTEAQLKAFKKYRDKIQADEDLKRERNKKIALRSAKNFVNNYADKTDLDTLEELQELIQTKIDELQSKD